MWILCLVSLSLFFKIFFSLINCTCALYMHKQYMGKNTELSWSLLLEAVTNLDSTYWLQYQLTVPFCRTTQWEFQLRKSNFCVGKWRISIHFHAEIKVQHWIYAHEAFTGLRGNVNILVPSCGCDLDYLDFIMLLFLQEYPCQLHASNTFSIYPKCHLPQESLKLSSCDTWGL